MSNYPDFNVTGALGLAPITPLGDNVMTQGIGFPLRPVSAESGQVGAAAVLTAQSVADQIPTALSVPLQVEFGAAQFGPADPVQISSAGLITFNEAGAYQVTTNIYVVRTTTPGAAVFLFRLLINGNPVANPLALVLDDAVTTQYQSISFARQFSVGDTIAFEVMRDATGVNNGQLEAYPTTSWGTTPSAIVRVVKF